MSTPVVNCFLSFLLVGALLYLNVSIVTFIVKLFRIRLVKKNL